VEAIEILYSGSHLFDYKEDQVREAIMDLLSRRVYLIRPVHKWEFRLWVTRVDGAAQSPSGPDRSASPPGMSLRLGQLSFALVQTETEHTVTTDACHVASKLSHRYFVPRYVRDAI
jgi:hypothetical protein